ncbi:hypothetical protein [Hymenobacter elongatus]|uniref:Uncharacterized protein n=1 Tax=Hymenobacter elongatus TaxID=877208 RepID=A0A4Z0PJ97_9BACT|nr:hypothetical protein [Hymenobacter elongatus]TGE15585.1 hypothetical protein E5J99_12365 [Hymenobacter elongatus]
MRTWFGLGQSEMALYLGVSPTLIHSIETERRGLTTNLLLALRPLLLHLPPVGVPAETPAPTSRPPGLPAPEAAELEFRRRVCRQQAARVERELAALEARARVAERWAQALPALQQAAAAVPPDPANPDRAAWLTGWLARQARPLPPEDATRWRLLRARLAALAAEQVALAEHAG